MFSSLRHRLPHIGVLPRRVIAVACLLLAALTALSARRPAGASGPTRPVVVAARALAVGHRIGRADVVARRYPSGLAPDGVAGRIAPLLGRVVAAPVARGEPLGAARTVGRDLADGLGPGVVATVVVLSGRHAADLLRPGDRVDVLAAPAGSGDNSGDGAAAGPSAGDAVVATGLRVLAVLPPDPDDTADVPNGLTGAGPEIVVAATEATAIQLTRASSTHIFTAFARAP